VTRDKTILARDTLVAVTMQFCAVTGKLARNERGGG
jgi:hypothetical protein